MTFDVTRSDDFFFSRHGRTDDVRLQIQQHTDATHQRIAERGRRVYCATLIIASIHQTALAFLVRRQRQQRTAAQTVAEMIDERHEWRGELAESDGACATNGGCKGSVTHSCI